jgi:hypothetical protein
VDESPFREMSLSPPDPWLAVWAEHRYRQRMAWGIAFGTFLLAVIAVCLGVIATVGWAPRSKKSSVPLVCPDLAPVCPAA